MTDANGLSIVESDEDDEAYPKETLLCYSAARRFRKEGLNVVPKCAAGGFPAAKWKKYQNCHVTDEEVLEHFHRYQGGVGFITGAVSNRVVLDTDGPEGEAVLAEFEKAHGPIPPTYTVRSGSGRGYHRHFLHPGYKVKTVANTSIKLDIKGDGGFCVLPPTLHKSGGRYEVVNDVPPVPLPEDLLAFIEVRAAKAKGKLLKPNPLVFGGEQSSRDNELFGRNLDRYEPLPVNLVNITIIISMLSALPDSYAIEHDEWLAVGFALHSFDRGKVGLALWKKFSERCPEKASETDFEVRWASFSNEYEGKKITLGTLWWAASEHGWRPLRKWDRSTNIKS